MNISIDSNTQPNVLTGATAEVRHYQGDGGFGVAFDKFDIPGLTDGDKAAEALGAIETPSTHKDDAWAIFTAPEGKSWNLSKVVVVEDLISTGGSSLQAVEALRKNGNEIVGMVASYTYGFQ